MYACIARHPRKDKDKLAEWLEIQGVDPDDIACWKGLLKWRECEAVVLSLVNAHSSLCALTLLMLKCHMAFKKPIALFHS